MIYLAKENPVPLSDKEKKVIQYIKDYEKKGYSDAKIRQSLLKSGLSQDVISKCMKLAHPSLYRKPLFWVGIAIPLLILILFLFFFFASQDACTSDSDCSRGYACDAGDCVRSTTEEEEFVFEEGIISSSVCGDGSCDASETCVVDCG